MADTSANGLTRDQALIEIVLGLAFILFFPLTLAINLQLPSNIWIIQTLPTVFLDLYTNWFHRRALIIGLLGGLLTGTLMIVARGFESSVFPVSIGGLSIPMYAAVPALVVNLLLCVGLTPLFKMSGVSNGRDNTTLADFEAHPVPDLSESLLLAQITLNERAESPTKGGVLNRVQ